MMRTELTLGRCTSVSAFDLSSVLADVPTLGHRRELASDSFSVCDQRRLRLIKLPQGFDMRAETFRNRIDKFEGFAVV